MIPQQSDLIRSNRNLLNLEFRKVFLAQNSLLVLLWTDLFSLSSRGCTVSQRGGRRSKMIFNAQKDLLLFSNCELYQKNTTHLRNVNIKMGGKKHST